MVINEHFLLCHRECSSVHQKLLFCSKKGGGEAGRRMRLLTWSQHSHELVMRVFPDSFQKQAASGLVPVYEANGRSNRPTLLSSPVHSSFVCKVGPRYSLICRNSSRQLRELQTLQAPKPFLTVPTGHMQSEQGAVTRPTGLALQRESGSHALLTHSQGLD